MTSLTVNGTPCRRPSGSPRARAASAARGLGARLLEARQDDRVDRAVALLDAGRVGVQQLDRTDVAVPDGPRHPRRRPLHELAHGAILAWRAAAVALGGGVG